MASEMECAGRILEVFPRLMRALVTEFHRQEGEGAITIPQYRILVRLQRSSCSMSELARCYGVTLPTMTKMINALVQKGLVERCPVPYDRRQVRLRLTKGGERVVREAQGRIQARLAEILGLLSSEEREGILASLEALQRAFRIEELRTEHGKEERQPRSSPSQTRTSGQRGGP